MLAAPSATGVAFTAVDGAEEAGLSFLAALPAVPAGVAFLLAPFAGTDPGGEQLLPLSPASPPEDSPSVVSGSSRPGVNSDLAMKSTKQLMTSEKLLDGFLEAGRADVAGATGGFAAATAAGVAEAAAAAVSS